MVRVPKSCMEVRTKNLKVREFSYMLYSTKGIETWKWVETHFFIWWKRVYGH